MARINFNDIKDTAAGTGFKGPRFFGLKNDKDFAVVRIMHPSTDSFEIYETHNVKTPKFVFGRTVACTRDPHDEMAKCPLCAAGYPVKQKMFVKLIEYVKQDNGQIVPEARVWERPIGFAQELAGKINIYGPLDQSIFIITRHTPNPNNKQDTTYTVEFAPPQQYPESIYKNAPELFEGYTPLGNALYAPTAEEMVYYLNNGDFPQRTQNNNQQYNAGNYTPATPQVEPTQYTQYAAPAPQPAAPPTAVPVYQADPNSTGNAPWAQDSPFSTTAQPAIQKPVRYY